jgi:hypothetical protein
MLLQMRCLDGAILDKQDTLTHRRLLTKLDQIGKRMVWWRNANSALPLYQSF